MPTETDYDYSFIGIDPDPDYKLEHNVFVWMPPKKKYTLNARIKSFKKPELVIKDQINDTKEN